MDRGVHEGIQVSVGQDFVVMGTDRIEVSPDGKTVTACTDSGIELKAAQAVPAQAGGAAIQGISISADFNTVVLNGVTIERAADGHLVISTSGTVITKPAAAQSSADEEQAGRAAWLDCPPWRRPAVC